MAKGACIKEFRVYARPLSYQTDTASGRPLYFIGIETIHLSRVFKIHERNTVISSCRVNNTLPSSSMVNVGRYAHREPSNLY